MAHGLSTVRHCDEVLFLEGGVVVSRGTFDEVAADNESFAALVRLGQLEHCWTGHTTGLEPSVPGRLP